MTAWTAGAAIVASVLMGFCLGRDWQTGTPPGILVRDVALPALDLWIITSWPGFRIVHQTGGI